MRILRQILKKNILIIIFCSILFFPISFFAFFNLTKTSIINEINLKNQNVALEINNKITNISRLNSLIFLSNEFQTSINNIGEIDNQAYYDTIYSKMSDIILFDSLIVDAAFYPIVDGTIDKNNKMILSSKNNLIDLNFISFKNLVYDPKNHNGRLNFVNIFSENNIETNYIAINRVVLGMTGENNLKPIGFGVFLVNKSQLFQSLSQFDESNIHATVNIGDSFYGDKKTIGDVKSINRELEYFNWKVESYYSNYTIFEEIQTFFFLYLITVFIFIAYIVSLVIFISNRDSKNYYLFKETFKNIKEGDLETIMPSTNNESINQVVSHFNEMMSAIKKLNEKIIEEETKTLKLYIENNQYMIKHLNSEINQHFLYNTFSLIRSLVNLKMTDEAVYCINNLSKVLRYSLSSSEMVLLEKEMESVTSYVEIQKFRKPNIKVNFIIDESLNSVMIPKFIIQPLVENSYKYGFEEDSGNIDIMIQKDEFITITVKDDGTGTTKERIDEINYQLKESFETIGNSESGLALINIKRRLKIYNSNSDLIVSLNNKNGFLTRIVIKDK